MEKKRDIYAVSSLTEPYI